MPFTARAELLVRQGKASNYSEACSLLARRRTKKNYGRTNTARHDPDFRAVESPRIVMRLPYADN